MFLVNVGFNGFNVILMIPDTLQDLQQMTGIAAILSYPAPHIEEEDV